MARYNINTKRIYANFERKNKWLGLIDYKTLSLIGVYISIIIFILSKINIELIYKIYILAFCSLPVCAMFVCSDLNQDSVFDMFITILKYLLKKSIYVKENSTIKITKKQIYKRSVCKD